MFTVSFPFSATHILFPRATTSVRVYHHHHHHHHHHLGLSLFQHGKGMDGRAGVAARQVYCTVQQFSKCCARAGALVQARVRVQARHTGIGEGVGERERRLAHLCWLLYFYVDGDAKLNGADGDVIRCYLHTSRY